MTANLRLQSGKLPGNTSWVYRVGQISANLLSERKAQEKSQNQKTFDNLHGPA